MVVEANGGILGKWYLGHLKSYLEQSADFEEQRVTSGGAEYNLEQSVTYLELSVTYLEQSVTYLEESATSKQSVT